LPTVSYTLLDSGHRSTASLRGKVTPVSFWPTRCGGCVAEMPEIVAAHQKFKIRGHDTLAVAMNCDPLARVARFAESRQLPFGAAVDNTGDIAKHFDNVQFTATA
jgi:peroxiredoxin